MSKELSPKEYLKIKYAGQCKCGDCRLVPASVLVAWERQLFEFSMAEVERLISRDAK